MKAPLRIPEGSVERKQLDFNRLIERVTFSSHKWAIKRLWSRVPRTEPRLFLPAVLPFRLP